MITIIIIASLALLLTISICINIIVIRGRGQKRIIEDNKAIQKADELKDILKDKGKVYDEKIKASKNVNDYIDIINDVMSNYGNQN